MHIPDHALSTETAVFSGIAGASVLAAAITLAARRRPAGGGAGVAGLRFAAVAALIFALQMLNFPVNHGTSGHFLGGALAVVTLGWAGGLAAMWLVLAVQTLVFGDGGITALGANFLTMGALAGSAALMAGGSEARFLRTAAVSGVSVLLAAALCSALIVVSGSGAAGAVFPAMLLAHLPVALLEGAITSLLAALIRSRRLDDTKLGVLALACAALASPFASPFPDGLESALAEAGSHAEAEPLFAGLLPDYTIPVLGDGAVSVSLAAVLGVAAVMILALGLQRLRVSLAPDARAE